MDKVYDYVFMMGKRFDYVLVLGYICRFIIFVGRAFASILSGPIFN